MHSRMHLALLATLTLPACSVVLDTSTFSGRSDAATDGDAEIGDAGIACDAPIAIYPDRDGDGLGDSRSPSMGCVREGFVDNGDDCDDACAACYPGAAEVCDGLDNDCDGSRDLGADSTCEWACGAGACDDPVRVAAGHLATCAIRTSGGVACWGGDATSSILLPSLRPVSVAGVAGVVEVAIGFGHGCARLSSGELACWGENAAGQLGDGTVEGRRTPQVLSSLPVVKSVAAGTNHTCAVSEIGDVYCWGAGLDGQLGIGSSPASQPSPIRVTGVRDVVEVAAGGNHSCARTVDGSVWCWGIPTGEEGGPPDEGGPQVLLVPTRISGVDGAVQLDCGFGHACAVLGDSTAVCWGTNGSGQLGVGGVSNTFIAREVASLGPVREVRAGHDHTCALRVDGTVACWGWNGNGSLGDGTTTSRGTPAPVIGLASVAALTSAGGHNCALRSDGQLWCWGSNGAGQVGDGSRTHALRPVRVARP